MAAHRRGPWTQAEDTYLCSLVQTQGALNWVRIAQLIGSRSPKQCRERYHQNLKPSLNHEPITPQEGEQIERMVAEMGKRWAEIARRLHGRSDNAVKNWWNGSMNRRRRLVLRRKTSNTHPHHHFEDEGDQQPFSKSTSPPHHGSPGTNLPHRIMDGSTMGSPTVSEASHAESVDRPPSLVSDASSAFSFSPQMRNTPSLELPPLNYQLCDSQRPSLPRISRQPAPPPPNVYSPERDNHRAYTCTPPRMTTGPQAYSSSTWSPFQQHQKQGSHTPTFSPPRGSREPRSQIHMDSSVRLPPLKMNNLCERPGTPAQRDARMHLSSLLG